jgi:hypothetical protein
MATLSFPKGKTAILIMDCQNDVVHENGKMAAMSGGAMAKLIMENGVLGKITRLADGDERRKLQLSTCDMLIVPTISMRRKTPQYLRQ